MKLKNKTFILLISILGCIMVYTFYVPIYNINDDIAIRDIVSGAFLKPCSFSYYLSIELGFLLKILYSLIGRVPWYGLMLLSVYIYAISAVITKIMQMIPENKRSMKLQILVGIFACIIMISLLISDIVLLHYTVTAAVAAATGIFLLITADERKQLLPVAVMFCMSYLIRENVFFMSMPYIGIGLIYLFVKLKSNVIKICVIPISTFAIVFSCLFVINRTLPLGVQWQRYRQYNKLRTTVCDYTGIPNDEEALEYYSEHGVDIKTVRLYKSYNQIANMYMSDEEQEAFDESMRVYSVFKEYGLAKKTEVSESERLKDTIDIFKNQMFRNGVLVNYEYFLLICYLVGCIVAVIEKKLGRLLFFIAVLAVRVTLWMYLIYSGRFPERVMVGVLILEAFSLMGIIADMLNNSKRTDKTKFIFMALITVCSIITLNSRIKRLNTDYSNLINRSQGNDIVFDYIKDRSDDRFLLDLRFSLGRVDRVFRLDDTKYNNYLSLGGWNITHPMTYEKIEQFKTYEGNVYFISSMDQYETVQEALLLDNKDVVDEIQCEDRTYRVYLVK